MERELLKPAQRVGGANRLMKTLRVLFVSLMATAIANADLIPFSWSTYGASSSKLSFSGVAAGPSSTDANGNLTMALGKITFPNPEESFEGVFTLNVNFLRPYGSSNPSYVVPFTVKSNVQGNHDTLLIDFPDAILLTFSGIDGVGSFTFGIPDVNFTRTGNPARTFELMGSITAADLTAADPPESIAAIPEPGSILLLCTVLGGAAALRRRKSRHA